MPVNISEKLKHWFSTLRTSLRARVAFGVALPVLIAMSSLSALHYWREYQVLEEQARLSAVQFGDMMIHSLNHAMLFKDGVHLVTTLEDIGNLENIGQIRVVGVSGKVLADNSGTFSPYALELGSAECQTCHQYPAEARPRSIDIDLPVAGLRIAAPIDNLPQCYECHSREVRHLGVLLIDMSLSGQQQHLISDLTTDLLVSLGITLLIAIGIYWLIHRLVVRRIDMIRVPMAEYTAGNLAARIERTSQVIDELCLLSDTFNHMADEIDRYTSEQEERSQLRERAIIDERERIARELHDGIAQMLAYVTTKAMAVRIMLQKGQVETADQHLAQLEEAARGLFVDVREAIVGLKMAGEAGSSLTMALMAYVEQLGRLSNLPVNFDWQPEIQNILLPAETELQLLRIIQEALTNARKHAQASQVWVSLKMNGAQLEVLVRDNGCGFDPGETTDRPRGHYGLAMMRERAEMIGAIFHLDTQSGVGTQVLVQLDLNGD